MGLFKSIFKSGEKKSERDVLADPKDLRQGDIIKFKFMAQQNLSNQQFQIGDVNTYDFEDRQLTEFVLQGDVDSKIFLIVDDTDDTPLLTISVKMPRSDVEQLFDLDNFGEIFDGDGHSVLTRKAELDQLSNWTAPLYRQEVQAESGYFHKGDYRDKELPQNESDGDSLEYYLLVSDDRAFAIEIEVYDGGETDVLVTVRRPLSDIEEMWPS